MFVHNINDNKNIFILFYYKFTYVLSKQQFKLSLKTEEMNETLKQ